MHLRNLRASRSLRLTALLVAVVALPAGALVWLGVRLASQDRELLAQQAGRSREASVRAVAQALALSITRAEQAAADGRGTPDVVRFTLEAAGLRASPAVNVAWLPRAPSLPDASDRAIDEIETLEYEDVSVGVDGNGPERRNAPSPAIGLALDRYAALASSASPEVRAGALLGMARLQRRLGAVDAALATYATLAGVTGASVAGAPVDLQARRARCAVLEMAGRTEALAREAASLETDWLAGRWALDRPSWDLLAADLHRWTGHAVNPAPSRIAFSAAAEQFWAARFDEHAPDAGDLEIAGQRIVIWSRSAPTPGGIAVTSERLDLWLDEAAGVAGLPPSSVSLRLAGHAPQPRMPESAGDLIASPGVTGLPWAVAVAAPLDLSAVWTTGQRLLFASLAMLIVLVAAGGYAVARLVRRELAVARLQSEFVAAVSHEFRTPLASIRHLTELLDESDDLPADRRRGFYRAVSRNAERLQRLVESLLDFSRLESGRSSYTLERTDVCRLVAAVASEFAADLESRGVQARIATELPGMVTADVDAASLSLALWNLLDNAVKYSPGRPDVQVGVRAERGTVVISVRDRGYGIPRHEQPEIFRRFARGAIATRAGIKGTGLGLAIVGHVARGHGGDVRVRSADGGGSEFHLVLPESGARPITGLPLASETR